jgi:hypothetical protein
MAQLLPIYLQLAPEMGGTRFGPFTARIDIGSDERRCQLVLPSNLGIFPVHAVAIQVEPGVLGVQPAGQGCQLFVTPNGQAQAWPVTSPVQMRPGDQLTLGTPAGPRFTMMADTGAADSAHKVMADARAHGSEAGMIYALSRLTDRLFGAPSAGGVAGEIQRRGQAEMLRTSPWREMYAIQTRLKSGVFTSPRALVSIAVALFGVISTGSLTCSGIFYAIYRATMW